MSVDEKAFKEAWSVTVNTPAAPEGTYEWALWGYRVAMEAKLNHQPVEMPEFTQLAKAVEDEIRKYCDSIGLKLKHSYNTEETVRWFMAMNIVKGIIPMLPEREAVKLTPSEKYEVADELFTENRSGTDLVQDVFDALSKRFDIRRRGSDNG